MASCKRGHPVTAELGRAEQVQTFGGGGGGEGRQGVAALGRSVGGSEGSVLGPQSRGWGRNRGKLGPLARRGKGEAQWV